MNISLEDVVAFVKIAELESFKEAAEELFVTPAALSNRLKNLEEKLGAKLLDRTTRNVEPSAVGRKFLPAAKRMLGEFDLTVRDLVDLVQVRAGHVDIAVNYSIGNSLLPEILRRFGEKHPEIRVGMSECTSKDAMGKVLSREVEFSLGQNVQGHPEIEYEPMVQDRFHLICHPDHPLAKRTDVGWADLAGHDLISMKLSSSTGRTLSAALGETAELVRGRIEADHFIAVINMVGKNLGACALPTLSIIGRPDLNLVSIPLHSPVIERTLGISTVRGRTLSPAAEALRNIAREVLSGFSYEAAVSGKAVN